MADRFKLIDIFHDTQNLSKNHPQLREATLSMQARTILYLRSYNAINPVIKAHKINLSIVQDTTFHCAMQYADEKTRVGVLNFANAFSPGGGVKNGAMAQEECLCRSSNLYSALAIPYIQKNYYQYNNKNVGNLGTDTIIYSPDVTVFKSDDEEPKLMDHWFKVDVLTCAAPYNDITKRRPPTREQLHDIFAKRIKNILEVAIANDIDVIVLGAFGCGAFNNPPDLVASIFKHYLIDMQYAKCFKQVVFAIKANDQNNSNLQAFIDAFNK